MSTQPERPQALSPLLHALPPRITETIRWTIWRYGYYPAGGWIPVHFNARGTAITIGRDLCSSFFGVEDAYEYRRSRQYPCDGVAMITGDTFVALELKNVFTLDPGEASDPPGKKPVPHPILKDGVPTAARILPWAANVIKEVATYSEISPDGLGVTLIVAGARPDAFIGLTRQSFPHPEGGALEIKHTGCAVEVTGRRWPFHSQLDVEDRPSHVANLASRLRQNHPIAEILPGRPAPVVAAKPAPQPAPQPAPAPEPIHTPTLGEYLRRSAELHAPRDQLPRPKPAAPPAKPESTDDPKILVSKNEWYELQERASRLARKLRTSNEERNELLERESERSRPAIDRAIEVAKAEFHFGRTAGGQAFFLSKSAPALAKLFHRNSDTLRDKLARLAATTLEESLPTSAIVAAVRRLHSEALETEPEEVHLRVAKAPSPRYSGERAGVA